MSNLHNLVITIGISFLVSTAVPLFFSALWTSFGDDVIQIVRTALIASLFGMIGGLAIIGFKVASAKPR